jgi:hypothetical protein
MAEKAESQKRQSKVENNISPAEDVIASEMEITSIQRAIQQPSRKTLTPNVIRALQTTHGNAFVQRLVQRSQHPVDEATHDKFCNCPACAGLEIGESSDSEQNIHRQIQLNKKIYSSMADLDQVYKTVANASDKIRQQIAKWVNSPDAPTKQTTFKSVQDLFTKANAEINKPENMNETDVRSALQDKGLKPAKKKELKERQEDLAEENAQDLKSYNLPLPEAASLYKPSAEIKKGSATGREDGAFPRVTNSSSYHKAQTIDVNKRDLLEELNTGGGLKQIGNGHSMICPGCGQINSITISQVDHQQPFADIRDRLFAFGAAMQKDAKLKAATKKLLGKNFDTYFIEQTNTVEWQFLFPTKEALRGYSNNISNLMLLCSACNLQKSDDNIVGWYRDNPLYGEPFINNEIDITNKEYVIFQTKHRQGLGVAARDWFNEYHWPTLQKLFQLEEAVQPIREGIHEENTTRYEAAFETDAKERGKLEKTAEHQGNVNTVYLGATAMTPQIVRGQSQPPFAKNSPNNLVGQYKKKIEEVTDARIVRTGEREWSSDKDFITGQTDGYNDVPSKKLTDSDGQGKYDAGFKFGQQQRKQEADQGYMDGITNQPDSQLQGNSPYDLAFISGQKRRQAVIDDARQNAKKKRDQIQHNIDKSEIGAFELLDLYNQTRETERERT